MKPVVLSFITDDDIAHTAHGFDSMTLRKKRLVRWVDEAFDQGALLTQLDLAPLLGVCSVDRYIRDYHRVEILWKHGVTDLDRISQLIRLSKRVVHQYVVLSSKNI